MTIRIRLPHPSKKQLLGIIVPPILLAATVVVIFVGKGYVISVNTKTFEKTGMLVVKSQPDGGKIYLDGEWKSATPNTFSNLRPKTYLLRVEKDGFSSWEKYVTVYPELVTDITAVLVSNTPTLAPLTVGGASQSSYSDSIHTIAYTTSYSKPGIWILPLGRPLPITLFQSTPTLVMADTEKVKYSSSQEILWSPTGDQILVKTASDEYHLFDVSQSKELQATDSAREITDLWQAETLKKQQAFLQNQTLDTTLYNIATDSKTIWSPDGKKFLYQSDEGDKVAIMVHNMEKPIPVDEKADYKTVEYPKDKLPEKILWYPDSYHFVTKEGGSLYLVRIDGTNKTEIYSGVMDGSQVFVTPDGNKVIVSASFKKDSSPELYAVSLR